jgi:acetolactate synthase I/II/III large subunit
MSDTKLTGAQIVLKALVDQGVDVLFGYPGGAVLPIFDALYLQNELRHILVRHEQGAVHAAEGYARSTGKVGVVLVTSGPGATNTVTGLLDAQCDSIPLVCITGQVPTSLIGNDAFQEADTTGITRPCTKHNYLVKDVNQLARVLHEAFYVARSGRPGPVVVDVPKDIQFAQGVYVPPAEVSHRTYRPRMKPETALVERAVELMANARRPVFYTGGGIVNSGPAASRLLRELVKATGFPITSTLMGLGCYPASGPQWLGMLGMHGTLEANLAMHECDVMINIGARFDDRVTGRVDGFSPGSTKIHVDIDPSSINKNVVVDLPIVGDCAQVLEEMLSQWTGRGLKADKEALDGWWARIESWRERHCLTYRRDPKIIKPQHALESLRAALKGRDHYITTEVGQHQMWAAQFMPFDEPNRWMTSGGLGTMGYGLPAAIGAQIAHPESVVVDIAGESSIQMNIQELSTAVQHRAPVKVFILNNEYMGMVRQWQELHHGKRYSESHTAPHQPDFVKLAEAFGCAGLRAASVEDLDATIQEMLSITDRPVVVDVAVDPNENCFPMIPGGKAHNEILLGPNGEHADAAPERGMVLI